MQIDEATSQNLVALAHRWHDKARRLERRGDVHQKAAYHEAMLTYHSLMSKFLEKNGDIHDAQEHDRAAQSHQEHIDSIGKNMAVESIEQIDERINKPQGHENIGDPISDDSREGKGPKKKMMGQTSSLVQTIAKIIAKGKNNDSSEN